MYVFLMLIEEKLIYIFEKQAITCRAMFIQLLTKG